VLVQVAQVVLAQVALALVALAAQKHRPLDTKAQYLCHTCSFHAE